MSHSHLSRSAKERYSALSRSIHEYKAGLAKFAGMFTDNYGLRLVFRGTQAYTDGKTVVVPELSILDRPGMTDQEIKEAMDYITVTRGYVYHESAHVILSDFEMAGIAHKEGGKKFHTLVNALEDVRIEYQIGRLYPGAREALLFTRDWLYVRVAANIVKEGQPHPFVQLVYALSILGELEGDAYKKNAIWKLLDKNIRKLALECRADVLEARAMTGKATATVKAIAHRIWKRLKEASEKEPEQDQATEQAGGGRGGKHQNQQKTRPEENTDAEDNAKNGDDEATSGSGGSESDGDSDGDGDSDVGGGSGGEDGADGLAADGGGDEEEDAPNDSGRGARAPKSDASDGTRPSGGGRESAEDRPPGAGGSTKEPNHDYRDDMLELDAESLTKDYSKYEQEMKRFAEEAAAALKQTAFNDRPYLVYSTAADEVQDCAYEDEHAAQYRASVAKIEESVRSVFGPLERTIRAVLQSQSLAYDVGGLEDGELDAGNLYALASRTSARVFKETVVSNTLKDTAVGITIDCSGSMACDNKYLLAQQTALLFGHTLNAVKIPFEVTTWTTGYTSTEFDCPASDQELYTRFGALHFRVIKSFTENWRLVRHRVAAIMPRNANYDGESVKMAATRLLASKAKRKVLFVLCDGIPSGVGIDVATWRYQRHQEYLREIVNEVRGSGIELIGIGIASPNAAPFYEPFFVNVPDVTQLPGVVLTQLKRILLARSSH